MFFCQCTLHKTISRSRICEATDFVVHKQKQSSKQLQCKVCAICVFISFVQGNCMQHMKTVFLVWNKATLLVKHILASTRAGISKTPADKCTIADIHECRWHRCHICTNMATQKLIYRLKLPWHSYGICCKTLASL